MATTCKRSVLILLAVLSFARPAHADDTREFIMACTYGVLAGTLVGAATLAFTNKPGDNLRNVARGASLGLYTGILLGAYVVYGVPSQNENKDQVQFKPPRLLVSPVIDDRQQIAGLFSQYRVLDF